MNDPQFLRDRLEERRLENRLRTLEKNSHLIDFASNDYLGFAQSPRLREKIQKKLAQTSQSSAGATGSRLISGNSAQFEALEAKIARFHQAEAGLIFNSGYQANLGLLASIAQKGDTIISDELIHASMIDGIRLSYANRLRFRHNDLQDLEDKLKQAKGNTFIAVESVYSMDGDLALLTQIVRLGQKYGAHVIVDEAHATGVFGKQGSGLVCALGLEDQVFARMHTFGKALGCHGAIVLGSEALKQYLINFARAFIYTTALPPHALVAIECAYELLADNKSTQIQLWSLIDYFGEKIRSVGYEVLESDSAIQGVIVPDNAQVKYLSAYLAKKGFYSKAILSPTVSKGKERLRICLHAFNTHTEIDDLIACISHHQKIHASVLDVLMGE
ncbi:MAG: 8-amino-7-oxononanoate synthase [Microscillaceae bacterium]|nr:8-amino-7-oxononanoate synthase [Microscillaceae bacterium]